MYFIHNGILNLTSKSTNKVLVILSLSDEFFFRHMMITIDKDDFKYGYVLIEIRFGWNDEPFMSGTFKMMY